MFMKKLFFETERNGFYGTYYANPNGADRTDDRLYYIQPICGVIQEKHGDFADRIPKDRKKESLTKRACYEQHNKVREERL